MRKRKKNTKTKKTKNINKIKETNTLKIFLTLNTSYMTEGVTVLQWNLELKRGLKDLQQSMRKHVHHQYHLCRKTEVF
jgi:hypothetical protein